MGIFGGGKKNKKMTTDELKQWLKNYYLYKILDPSSGCYNTWAFLDNIDSVADSVVRENRDPEAFIKEVQNQRGPPPPDDWSPLTRGEALQQLREVTKEFGQDIPEANLEALLTKLEAQGKPYECGIATIRKKLLAQAEHQNGGNGGSALKSPHTGGRPGGAASPKAGGRRREDAGAAEDSGLSDRVKNLSSLTQSRDRDRERPGGDDGGAGALRKTTSGGQLLAKGGPAGQQESETDGGLDERAGNQQRLQLAQSVAQAHKARRNSTQGGDAARVFAPSSSGHQNQQVAVVDPQHQLDVVQLAQDYSDMQQELQLLKQTIKTQVDTHKQMIDLQKQQQDFLNEYLHSEERENEVMVKQARLLQRQYTTALEQWQVSHNHLMSSHRSPRGSPGRYGSPVHVHAPSPQKSRGVATWLASLGMEDYIDVFAFNEIDFQSLTMLDDEDLVRMGIQAMGPRKTIMRGIAELARQQIHEAPHTRTRDRSILYGGSPPRAASPYRSAGGALPAKPSQLHYPAGSTGGTYSAARGGSPMRGGSPRPNLSPAEWKAHVDSNTGRVYYYNTTTGESKWDMPTAPASPNAYTKLL